jgi:hypothetical protein
MRHLNIFTTALLLFVCQTTFAQYDHDYDEYGNPIYIGNQYQYNSYSDDLEEGWGNVYIEYSPMQRVSSAKGVDKRTFHAATFGVNYNFQLGYSPVYLGASFEATGAWFTKRYSGGTKYSVDLYYSKIPINLSFRFNISDGFAIAPYGGAYIKWNIYGEEREKDKYGNTETWRLFDDEYTYDNDYNRFQFGYQAGVKLIIANCVTIGASWQADLTNFCKYYDSYSKKEEREKFRGFAFSLGYGF